jgi:predicted nucleic acid-binding protein
VIVLDTTVLVYAVGTDHALRDPCRRLVDVIADGQLDARTTVQAIQEFAHVRARRRGRADAATLAADYAELLSPLLDVGRDDLLHGLDLFAAHERFGAFDAVLAAAAIGAGATALASADRGFADVPGLTHVMPDAAGVAALLG